MLYSETVPLTNTQNFLVNLSQNYTFMTLEREQFLPLSSLHAQTILESLSKTREGSTEASS